MADEIAHICKNIPKRGPGDEGEKIACEYMATSLKTIAVANAPTSNPLRKIPIPSSVGFTLPLLSHSQV